MLFLPAVGRLASHYESFAGGDLHTAGTWRYVPAAAGHAEPGHGRFKPPAPWHMGMRRGDAHSSIAPCRAIPSPWGTQAPHCWQDAQQLSLCCALGFLRLAKESTRHPFHSSKNLPVTCAGFCRGRAMLSWWPGMVLGSTPTLSSVTQKGTELSPANAATLAHLLHLPSYVAIGTTAPASAPAVPCHAASAPHWAQPTSASLEPDHASPSLTNSLPHPLFLGDNQITAVAVNYCISYNLPIHLSFFFPPTLEQFHLSILSTFTLPLLFDSHPLFSCTPQPQSFAAVLYPFLLLYLPTTHIFCALSKPLLLHPLSQSSYSFLHFRPLAYYLRSSLSSTPVQGYCQLLPGLSQACSSPVPSPTLIQSTALLCSYLSKYPRNCIFCHLL